ncbi:CTP synthase [Candidatus Woesearchaeota archaeon]|nr:CTP synthase [Candidatus Woesearchaeota archaeon]
MFEWGLVPQKFIVVSGGVLSGIGKGVATASIGKILQQYGFSVTAIKIDPYINCDAGTLRPTEHGEVWVTDDGGEIDQDLGNYERFLNIRIPKKNNITTGQVYKTIIDKERSGEYLGKTVQFIPHVPDEIKKRVISAADGFDIALIEIGGTIGDYENIPFLFAMKSLERELGRENVAYILVTYLPTPSHIGEPKTKPTQQAIKTLGESGIFPDFILCRGKDPLDDVRKKKIEIFANINSDCVISAPDVPSVYSIPLNFEKEKLGEKIMKRLQLEPKQKPDWTTWNQLLHNIENPTNSIKIAIIGKYVDTGNYCLQDSYISIGESLKHAAAHSAAGIEISWIDSKKYETGEETIKNLHEFDGIIVPGGFGASGVEGKITTIKFCRENNIPYLGLCYGLQLAVVEFARHACNLELAHTTEVVENTPHPVIDLQPAQKEILAQRAYGASMRLGAYCAVLNPESNVFKLYEQASRIVQKNNLTALEEFRKGILNDDKQVVVERHRHRYEVNPKYVDVLEKNGLIFSGHHLRNDDTKLMEYIELKNHPFFVGTQAHPEFLSSIEHPSPIFMGFVKACVERKEKRN